MPISDIKKCQTLINIVADQVDILQAATSTLKTMRSAFIAQAVDPTGTPLEGHVQQISAWIDGVESVANNAIANGFLDNRVESHGNKALGDL